LETPGIVRSIESSRILEIFHRAL